MAWVVPLVATLNQMNKNSPVKEFLLVSLQKNIFTHWPYIKTCEKKK